MIAASIVPRLMQYARSRATARATWHALTDCTVTTSRATIDRVTPGLRVAQEARALGNGVPNV